MALRIPQALSVCWSLLTTSGPTFVCRNCRITGTNFFASSAVRPSLPKPPRIVEMSAAFPPMAPAIPPSNPPRPPPPPVAGAFFMRSDNPGTPPSSLPNSAAPSLSCAALNNTPAPPSAWLALTPRFLVNMSTSSFMRLSLLVVRGSGKTIGAFAPRAPHERHFADGDVGLARGDLDRPQCDRRRIERRLELRDFGVDGALRFLEALPQHLDAFLGAGDVLRFLSPARGRAGGGSHATDVRR